MPTLLNRSGSAASCLRLPWASRAVPRPSAFSTHARLNNSSPSSSSGPTAPPPHPPPPSPSTSARQQRRTVEWALVGVAGGGAGLGLYYFYQKSLSARSGQQAAAGYSTSAAPGTFTINVSTRDGPRQRVLTMLTQEQVDSRLRENERSTTIERPKGANLVARYDTNSVAANSPIEDKRAEVIVERDRKVPGSPASDLAFFAVFDGHSGFHTSTLLSQKLISYVALELDRVFREAGGYADIAKAKASMPSKLWAAIFGGGRQVKEKDDHLSSGLDNDPEVIKLALQQAFLTLDREIVQGPVELLKEYERQIASGAIPPRPSDGPASSLTASTPSLANLARSIIPSSSSSPRLSTYLQSGFEALQHALSGSCALLAYIDSARRDLYVSCTGDARAVAGYWDQEEGRWRVEALSEDQTAKNEKEIKRIRSEHPGEEDVIRNGRVLGSLEPSRAFGDARYKWDRELQGRLYDAFVPGGRAAARPPPLRSETPPYVTARPVTEWRRLGERDGQQTKGELRFLVLATDGLWDRLSNEDVVALVAGHLEGQEGTMDANELHRRTLAGADPASAPATAVTAATGTGTGTKEKSKAWLKGKEDVSRTFTFEDDNLATHLIRNRFGGGNRERVASLLAIPSPEARRYRDDTTVSVILFNKNENGSGSSSATGTASASAGKGPSDEPIKAKL